MMDDTFWRFTRFSYIAFLLQAKLLYPDVPIECVLSVGTGFYVPKKDEGGMSWNTVVNQLVNSATVSFWGGCKDHGRAQVFMCKLGLFGLPS